MASSIEIFYSYSHKDEALREELKKQLSLLKWQGLITGWHDRRIVAGQEWADEIDTHLNTAQIILLMVSPDFMASKYCYGVEVKRAMERHERGEAIVIPVILRPVYWQGAPFSKLQALPTDAKPVTSSGWHNTDEAFFNVAEGIRKIVELPNLATDQIKQYPSAVESASVEIQVVNSSLPMPEGMSWIEELSIDKPFSHVWPTQIDKYLHAWKGSVSLRSKPINIKIGEIVYHERGRLVVFFNQEPICEFAETLDHKGWASLIKPNGRNTLQMDKTPPILYQGTRIERYREVTGLTGLGVPKGAAIVIAKEDLRSAVHHAVARWLGRRDFPIQASI